MSRIRTSEHIYPINIDTFDVCPVIETIGDTRYDLGVSHGKQLKLRIEALSHMYIHMFLEEGTTIEWLQRFANDLCSYITNNHPKMASELKGISDGAEIALWKVYIINGRTEIINLLNVMPSTHHSIDVTECSAIQSRRANILAQTWDFRLAHEKLCFVQKITVPNKGGLSIVMLNEAGMIGKIGLNSSGIGCCLTLLLSDKDYSYDRAVNSVPMHMVMRYVLECESMTDVKILLNTIDIYTKSCLGIMDDRGNGFFLECHCDVKEMIPTSVDRLSPHTNHYLGCAMQYEHTGFAECHRFATLTKSVALYHKTEQSIANDRPAIKQMLDRPPVKRAPALGTTVTGGKSVSGEESHYKEMIHTNITVCTIVMDLANRRMEVTRGNPFEHPFETFFAVPHNRLHSKL